MAESAFPQDQSIPEGQTQRGPQARITGTLPPACINPTHSAKRTNISHIAPCCSARGYTHAA